MKFIVRPEVFEALPNACFGAVIAPGVNNEQNNLFLRELLQRAAKDVENEFQGTRIKESPHIKPYRDAFRSLDINPNKFPPSIEALITRIAKGKGMPSINPIVDVGNTISLQHRIPVGAHAMPEDTPDDGTGTTKAHRKDAAPLEVRFSTEGDSFVPFGEKKEESLPPGELIYAVGGEVRTRKWIWRQSERGKITATTHNVIFPMDGFVQTRTSLEDALEELSNLIEKIFHIKPVHATITAETHNVISVM